MIVLLFLQHLAIFVPHLLELNIAIMTIEMVALSSLYLFPNAAVVAVTLTQSLVLPTRSLDPDSGSQCTPHFALQKAVALKVSGEKSI